MTDDTASPMPGTEAESDSRRKDRWIVAAVAAFLALVTALLVVRARILRRRERAAVRHLEALGGECHWKTDPPSWLFSQLAPLLGKRFAKGRKRLSVIRLDGRKVADADVVYLKGFTGLERLHLQGTQVTDAGLLHLKGLTRLKVLRLFMSKRVTDAGVAHL
ncbi:MAG: hypothetical protein ACYTFI_26245, partial [Planctomycetota bacterium]